MWCSRGRAPGRCGGDTTGGNLAAPGEPGQVAVDSTVQCCTVVYSTHPATSRHPSSPRAARSLHILSLQLAPGPRQRQTCLCDLRHARPRHSSSSSARGACPHPRPVSRVHGYDGVWAGSRVQGGHLQGGVQLDVPARVVVGGEAGEWILRMLIPMIINNDTNDTTAGIGDPG